MRRVTGPLFAVLRTTIAIALLLYLGLSGAINWSALTGLWAVWPLTLAAFVLLLVDHAVTAWRLCVLFKPRGLQLSFASSIRLTLMGTFFNTCLPGSLGGDVVKIYYATDGNRGRRAEVATVMLLDRAIGMIALLVWPLLVVPFFLGMVAQLDLLRGLLGAAATLAAAIVVGMLLGSSGSVRNTRPVDLALRRLPGGGHARTMLETLGSYHQHAGTLVASLAISLLAHSLAMAVTLLVARIVAPGEFAWEMSLLLPLGFLVNTVPLTPGGLGIGEAAFARLFAMAGLAGGAEVLLGWRLLTILSGLIGLVFYLQGRQRFVHEAFPVQVRGEASLT